MINLHTLPRASAQAPDRAPGIVARPMPEIGRSAGQSPLAREDTSPHKIIHPPVDGQHLAALKAPPMPRAAIILLVSLAFALGTVTTYGLHRALAIAAYQHQIARV